MCTADLVNASAQDRGEPITLTTNALQNRSTCSSILRTLLPADLLPLMARLETCLHGVCNSPSGPRPSSQLAQCWALMRPRWGWGAWALDPQPCATLAESLHPPGLAALADKCGSAVGDVLRELQAVRCVGAGSVGGVVLCGAAGCEGCGCGQCGWGGAVWG